jgi:predicted nucleotidyltransferase
MFDAARDILEAALPDAWALYVYGSFARGDEHGSSDLDLAILQPPNLAVTDKLTLMADVSRATGVHVDLVDLRRTNLDLVFEVLREGKPLLIRCKDETLAWEAEQMTDYALFNPRRTHILSQYMREPLRNAE